MRLTPLDIREQQFRRVMRGLDPEEVESFLASVAGEFETLVAGNNELRQRVLELEEKITEYKSMEKALRDALLAAERVMGEAKESAQREAGLIVREAEISVERAKSRLSQDLVHMQQELAELRRLKDAYVTRVRWLLRSHLELIDGHAQEFSEIDAGLAPRVLAPGNPETAPRFDADPARFAAPARTYDPAPPMRPFDPTGRGPAMPSSPPPPAAPPGESGPRGFEAPMTEPPAFAEGWQIPSPSGPPFAGSPAVDLDDVLRPVGPDGTYELQPEPPLGRPTSAEEIAQAARRAERLAAEARAELERHGSGPESGWDRSRPGPGGRG
jgi:cell division initiation protein